VLGLTGKLFVKIKIQYSVTTNLLNFCVCDRLYRLMHMDRLLLCVVCYTCRRLGVIVQLVGCFRLLYICTHLHIDTVLLVFKNLNSLGYFRLLCIHKRLLNVGYGGVQCCYVYVTRKEDIFHAFTIKKRTYN
jgi:hypothetical protein